MAAPPLEAATAALRQDHNQSELLLRSLQQNLTFENESFSHDATATGGAGAPSMGAAGDDWSFTLPDQWGNIAPVMKKAVATLGRTLSQQTAVLLSTASKADETHKRMCRIEDTLLTVQKSIEALALRSGEHGARIDRLDAHRGASGEQAAADFSSLRQQMDTLSNEVSFVRAKTSTFAKVEDGMQRLGLEVASIRGEDIPAIKQRVSSLANYETGLNTAMNQLKELQDTAISARYASAGLGGGMPSPTTPAALSRSCGRWVWEGRCLLNQRCPLVQWDSRTLDVGDALRWAADKTRYAVEIRRGGLYKVSAGLVCTNASVATDSMMIYLDDDSLLSTVHSASFIAHSSPVPPAGNCGQRTLVTSPGSSRGKQSFSAGGRRHSASHCCAADCSASCFTSLTSNDVVYLPGRSLLCVRCTANPIDIACGFLEVQEFA